MQNQNNTNPMETGSIPKLLAQLAIPAVVAQVINLLYNIVDRIYIGHIPGIGASALTGVGLFAPILMLLNAFAMLVGSGGAPRAAIAMGKKDHDTAEKIVGNCFTLLTGLAVILTIIFYISAPTLLKLFGASSATMSYATAYARIYILGSFFVLIVLGMNPFITTQGFAKISMMTTVIGAVINIILDPVFIFVLGMGVRGAALATVLSQAVGAIWILALPDRKENNLTINERKHASRSSCIRSVPCTRYFNICHAVHRKSSVDQFHKQSFPLRWGCSSRCHDDHHKHQPACSNAGSGNTVRAGQPIIEVTTIGANKPERVKRHFFTQFCACVAYTFTFWAVIMLFPQVFASIFTANKELVEYSSWALRIYMAGIFSTGFQISCQQSFMALGQAKVSLLLACLRKIILLIPLIFILPHFLPDKVFAVFLAEPVSDILAAAATTITFLTLFNSILKKETK